MQHSSSAQAILSQNRPKPKSNFNAGSWSLNENLAFAIFIDINKKSMTSKKKMRQMMFFEKLSMFVATRTSSQCRSHHQKLLEKYKHISTIIEVFRCQIALTAYKTRFIEGLEKMKRINETVEQQGLQASEEAPNTTPRLIEHHGPNSQVIEPPVHYPFMPAAPFQSMQWGSSDLLWVPITMPSYQIMPAFQPQ